jgi:hypothetical protein
VLLRYAGDRQAADGSPAHPSAAPWTRPEGISAWWPQRRAARERVAVTSRAAAGQLQLLVLEQLELVVLQQLLVLQVQQLVVLQAQLVVLVQLLLLLLSLPSSSPTVAKSWISNVSVSRSASSVVSNALPPSCVSCRAYRVP